MPLPIKMIPLDIPGSEMEAMTDIANELTSLIDSGYDENSDEVDVLISQWNLVSVKHFEFSDFRDYHSWIGTEEFVKTAFYKAQYCDDLSYDEAKAIIEFVYNAEGDEALHHYALDSLELNFPNSNASGLIYHPDHWFDDDSMFDVDLTSDEMLGYLMKKSNRDLTDAPDMKFSYPLPVK